MNIQELAEWVKHLESQLLEHERWDEEQHLAIRNEIIRINKAISEIVVFDEPKEEAKEEPTGAPVEPSKAFGV